jgi:hypothetical protein
MSKTTLQAFKISALLSLLFWAVQTQGDIIVADSLTEYSGVQGSNNWYYGFWQKTGDADGVYDAEREFALMPRYGAIRFQGTPAWDISANYWTALGADIGHPNGVVTSGGRSPVEQWAIRRWVSPVAGGIIVTGLLAKFNTAGGGGDGIVGNIRVDGTSVFTRQIAGTDGVGIRYSVEAAVNIGSVVDFIVTPGPAANDQIDGTRFSGTIILKEPVPSPLRLSPLERLPESSMRIAITNRPNTVFLFQMSSNLAHWVTVATNTLPIPIARYVETNVLSSRSRFYRVEARSP